jgi:hypothetical protein
MTLEVAVTDSKTQLKVEKWVRDSWLPQRYGVAFNEGSLELTWGGKFQFDAIGAAGRIVGLISTSAERTAGSNLAVGKIKKIQADTLYLLNARGASQRLLIFTEHCMHRRFCDDQQKRFRFPPTIELLHVEDLPADLRDKLSVARQTAVEEVSPLSVGADAKP